MKKAHSFSAVYAAMLLAWAALPASSVAQQRGQAQAIAPLASHEAAESGGSGGAGRGETSRAARHTLISDEPAESPMGKEAVAAAERKLEPSAAVSLASEQSALGR